MPTYDYRCNENAKIVEVKHPMSNEVKTWGELCELAGIDIGDTPANSPAGDRHAHAHGPADLVVVQTAATLVKSAMGWLMISYSVFT